MGIRTHWLMTIHEPSNLGFCRAQIQHFHWMKKTHPSSYSMPTDKPTSFTSLLSTLGLIHCTTRLLRSYLPCSTKKTTTSSSSCLNFCFAFPPVLEFPCLFLTDCPVRPKAYRSKNINDDTTSCQTARWLLSPKSTSSTSPIFSNLVSDQSSVRQGNNWLQFSKWP